MWFGIISLFPEMFQSLTEQGVTGRAFRDNKATITFWNPRDFTQDVHRTVDDRPYGGGPGMLMKTQPLADAIDAAQEACIAENGCRAKVVYLSPQGQRIDQALITRAVSEQQLILLCGRYEGIDERLIETQVDEEWSLGDFILSGGELAAMSIMDAMLRLVPGVLGHDQSAGQDSFSDGLLECPQFTRPEDWQGHKVPEVLLSGHHEAIKQWRKAQAEQRTKERRPDLYEKYNQQK
jgi:tRNA (guanine37-N1)-methyltransferase